MELTSNGPGFVSQRFSFGFYVLNATEGFYTKIHDYRFEHYLFKLENLNVWAIGPQVGVNYLYLVHVDGFKNCPEDVHTGSWFYTDKSKKWQNNDQTIRIKCL